MAVGEVMGRQQHAQCDQMVALVWTLLAMHCEISARHAAARPWSGRAPRCMKAQHIKGAPALLSRVTPLLPWPAPAAPLPARPGRL